MSLGRDLGLFERNCRLFAAFLDEIPEGGIFIKNDRLAALVSSTNEQCCRLSSTGNEGHGKCRV